MRLINFKFKKIPTELKQLPQWVNWKYETREGKITKPPIQLDGHYASSTKAETWTTFEKAKECYKTHSGNGVAGVGFCFSSSDSFVGIDLDSCRNPETGAVESWAKEIIKRLATYCEVSPSNTGIKIFGKGEVPRGFKKSGLGTDGKGKIEIYSSARYFTMTGWHLAGTPANIEDCSKELTLLFSELSGGNPEVEVTREGTPDGWDLIAGLTTGGTTPLSDTEVIEKARQAANREKFCRLFDGNWEGYASQSNADDALCVMLAFWCGNNAAQIDRLFRMSKLYRKKWDDKHAGDGRTYGQMTIQDAVRKNEETYFSKIENTLQQNIQVEVGINLTDLGNARRFVKDHRQDLHYCFPYKKWLCWDGQRWKADDTGEVHRRAKETISRIYAEAAATTDEKERKEIAKHALRSESQKMINAMIESARSEPGIPILPEKLDLDPWLFNVANGTIDLRYEELRPHSREDFITKISPVDYKENALCRSWIEHLTKIMAGNEEMILYLQRAFGYSLSGITDERVIFILYGPGANGKTITNETIAQTMGDYSLRTPTETLLQKRNQGNISNDVARLQGARFTFSSEADEGRKFSESTIKDLTGGDTISARHLYQEYREFRPECKLWLATNHKPVIRGTDNAIWDRIRLIPFTVSIPEKERIPRRDLMALFAEEMPGILTWMVKGCLNWQGAGLGIPAEVRQATAEYRDEMDVLKNFLNEKCVIDRTAETTAKNLNEKYREWCIENRERPMTQTKLGKRLDEMGFKKERKKTGINWIGFGLLAEQ